MTESRLALMPIHVASRGLAWPGVKHHLAPPLCMLCARCALAMCLLCARFRASLCACYASVFTPNCVQVSEPYSAQAITGPQAVIMPRLPASFLSVVT